MATGILNKLRRRQSTSPHRTQPHSYVHHASTPPEWPTSPAQVTPDVYITSPPEEDGLLTSVCVHRAIEHEPKRRRKHEGKHEERPVTVPVSAAPLSESHGPAVESPPAFRRSSMQAPEVVLPKKSSEILRESSAKWRAGNKQSANDKNVSNQDESQAQGADVPAAGRVQWDGSQALVRVSSGREAPDGLGSQLASKSKSTLRHRASKVLKTFTNREGLHFGSSTAEKRVSLSDVRTNGSQVHKRRNTLSDNSHSAFNTLAQAATAHALPKESNASAETSAPPAPKSSIEGRRRSSTLGHVEFTPRPTSPLLPPTPKDTLAEDARAASDRVVILEPPAEIVATDPAKGGELQNLQRKRNKNAFSNLFNLKGEKLFRSPPPAKPVEVPAPPVPVIPEGLAKAVADPGTPASQTSFTSPPTAATPKSSKSRRFRRHRRRPTAGSISRVSFTGTPSSISTIAQAETPKTPTSPRSPFSIVDLRKGFSVRGLGKSKGKLFSAKSSPGIGPPPPPVSTFPLTSENHGPPETVMQRYKMSRPPPLSTESPKPSQGSSVPLNEDGNSSPITVEFVEPSDNTGAALPSPTDSDGPATPMFGAQEESTPAPAIELDQLKVFEEVPELSHSPPTSDENDQAPGRPSSASEATILAEDPMFGALSTSSTLGDLQLQLREPSTKTSTLDAHLRLDSLRFDNFSFDTNVF